MVLLFSLSIIEISQKALKIRENYHIYEILCLSLQKQILGTMEKMELIELGLNEVARECRIIERVAAESRFCIELMEAKGKPADSVYHDMANEHEAMLNDVHQKVVELLEFVGEYMNGHDMVGAVDVAINKTIYDLVYERTDETSYECNKED